MRLIIASIFIFISTATLYAAEPVIITSEKGEYPLGLHMDILEDKTRKLTIDDMLTNEISSKFLESKSSIPKFGFTNNVYWIRFTILNNLTIDHELYIEHQFAPMDKIILFVPQNDHYIQKSAGDLIPFKNRDIKYKNSIFTLHLKPLSNNTFFMKFDSTSTMNLPLILWKPQNFVEDANKKELISGFFYGIMAIMIVYNFLVFFSVKDISYFYYIFYTLSATLFYSTLNGHSFQYLWNNLWWSNTCLPIFMSLTIALGLQFNRSFLHTRSLLPEFDIILIIFLILSVILFFIPFFIRYSISIQLATVLSITSSMIMLLCGIISLLRGNRAARFYILAWSLFLIGTIIQSFRAFAILQDTFFSVWSQQIGAVFEVTLLSFALADRINIMKKEKDSARDEVIQIHKSYSDSLEKTVQERTSELEIEKSKLKSKNDILESDVALARKIQEQLIPEPDPTNYIYSLYQPMQGVGGDLYDFVHFRDSNKIGIFISDVSGHGVSAAFITSMIKTTILQSGKRKDNPAELMLYINDVLQNQTAGNFITAFYGIYNPDNNSILYSNAGHPQPYLINDDGISQLPKGRNTALAMFTNSVLEEKNKSYTNFEQILPANSKLLFYTDGMTEASPVNSSLFFEDEPMMEIFMDNRNHSSQLFIAELHKSLTTFRGADSFEDDVCLVCLSVI